MLERILVVVDKDRSVVFAGEKLKVHNTRGKDGTGCVLLVLDKDTQVGVFQRWHFWMKLDDKFQLTTEKPLVRSISIDRRKILDIHEEIKLLEDLKKLKTCLEQIDISYNDVVKRYMDGYPIIDTWVNTMGKRLEEIATREFEIHRRSLGAPDAIDTPEKLAKWLELVTEKTK